MPRQESFAGGEISPELYGRTRIPRYGEALRTCLNYLPTPLGPLKNRAGTTYVAAVKDSARTVRLVPFVFSAAVSQTYVLEFGHLYIRFHQGGAVVESSPGVPLEVVTTYVEADLARLRFAQSGDVLTIVHASYRARNLTRTAHTSWAIANIDFNRTPNLNTITVDANPAVDATSIPAQVGKNWFVVYTAVDANGIEHYPSFVLTMAARVLYNNRPATYTLPAVTGAVLYNVYRSRQDGTGHFGFVGSTSAATFVDDGAEPDYTQQPPSRVDEMDIDTAGDYPSSVAYFQGRLFLGGSTNRPRTIWGSELRHPYVFDGNEDDTPKTQADAALAFTMDTLHGESLRALLPMGQLVAFTSEAERTASGGQDGPITPTSIDTRARSTWGSDWLSPLLAGDSPLFVQAGANVIRDLAYDDNAKAFTGLDLTLFAGHLFDGHTIVDWCFQKLPWPIIWAVRDDGVLLGCTYVRRNANQEGVWAWHRHTTSGTFESVCCIPENNSSALYAVIKRTVNGATVRYVERFASRLVTDDNILTACFVDSSLSFDGRNAGVATMTVSGASYAVDSAVTVLASVASFALTDVGDHLVLSPDGAAPVHILVTGYTDTTHITGALQAALPLALQATASTDWAWARDTFSGLDHLEGLDVNGLGDGGVVGPFTVTGGEVTLTEPVVDLTLGLSYLSDGELLDVIDPKDNQKRVTRVFIEVVGSRGLKAGERFDGNLDSWTEREVSDGFSYLPTDATVVEILIEGEWNRGGRAVFRQEDPLPLTILAVTREFEAGGK